MAQTMADELETMDTAYEELAKKVTNVSAPPEPAASGPRISLYALIEGEVDAFNIDYGSMFGAADEYLFEPEDQVELKKRRDTLVQGLKDMVKDLFARAAEKVKDLDILN